MKKRHLDGRRARSSGDEPHVKRDDVALVIDRVDFRA